MIRTAEINPLRFIRIASLKIIHCNYNRKIKKMYEFFIKKVKARIICALCIPLICLFCE